MNITYKFTCIKDCNWCMPNTSHLSYPQHKNLVFFFSVEEKEKFPDAFNAFRELTMLGYYEMKII